jgi:hypothetical protein
MRWDMSKVIVERPRRTSRLGHKRDASLAEDRKSLNEKLAPLRRYLAKQGALEQGVVRDQQKCAATSDRDRSSTYSIVA